MKTYYRARCKAARKNVIKLHINEKLNEKSETIVSSSTMDAEAIELMEITSKDKDTTVKGADHEISFIEPGEIGKLLPLRELQGLDKELKTIKGSLKIATAKCVDLKARSFVSLYYACFLILLSPFLVVFVEGPRLLL